MLEIFNYGFMVRAFIAGGVIALIAPTIGIFLVVKRYSLLSDSLSHVALAGIAIGIISGVYPVITAIFACLAAAIMIEWLRGRNKAYGDAILSLFLSGSLAIALVLISLAKGFNLSLFSYLFGSITSVTQEDIIIILALAAVSFAILFKYYRKFLYVTFDEEAAKVTGLPVKRLNLLLMALAAVTVSISMRIVGVLMISALMVMPVISAMQIASSFKKTVLYSIFFSIVSVFGGLFISYYLNIVAGGAIVFLALIIFVITLILGGFLKNR